MRPWLMLAVATVVASCVVEIADLREPVANPGGGGTTASGGSGGAGGAGGAGGVAPCPDDMVHAFDEALDVSFCIDRTEVTEGAYVTFLVNVNGAVPVADQPAACSGNTELTHKPDGSCPDFTDTSSQQPVQCVDWCDAHAYCKWAGKRLCGALGGGALGFDDSPVQGEWHFACTGGLKTVYPYGDDPIDGACNVPQSSDRADVGTFPQCEGGFGGLFDMQGNVDEWVDACQAADPSAHCRVRGGNTFGTPTFWRCDNQQSELQLDPDRREGGFRCCRDADE